MTGEPWGRKTLVPSARPGWRTLLGLCLLHVVSCKSAEERCQEKQASAEAAWKLQEQTLVAEQEQTLATQAACKSKLATEVEPRMSAAAAAEAARHYDRNSDAFMRAYQSGQNLACARDPECAKLKHDAVEATDKAGDLVGKLSAVRLALAAVRGNAEAAMRAADAVVPELGNTQLDAAKLQSKAAYAACKDLPPPKSSASK